MRTKRNLRDQISTHAFFGQPIPGNRGAGHGYGDFGTIDGHDMRTWTKQFEALISNFPTLVQQEETRALIKQKGDLMPKVPGDRWPSTEIEAFAILVEKVFEYLMVAKGTVLSASSEARPGKAQYSAETTIGGYRTARSFDMMFHDLRELHYFTHYYLRFTAFQNIEKVFEFGAEEYKSWLATFNQPLADPGSVPKKREPTIRQRFTVPMDYVKMPAKKDKHRKKLEPLAAARELTRNCNMLVKDIQYLNRARPGGGGEDEGELNPAKLPPKAFYYGPVLVTSDYPQPLRQLLFDMSFLKDTLIDATYNVQAQGDLIRNLLAAWASTRLGGGNEPWNWAKSHVQNNPRFQKYEYLRAEMFAIFEVGYRMEKEVYLYFDKHGRSASTSKIEELLRVGVLTEAERFAQYEKQCADFFSKVIPVDEIVQLLDQASSPMAAEFETPSDEWLNKFLAPAVMGP